MIENESNGCSILNAETRRKKSTTQFQHSMLWFDFGIDNVLSSTYQISPNFLDQWVGAVVVASDAAYNNNDGDEK